MNEAQVVELITQTLLAGRGQPADRVAWDIVRELRARGVGLFATGPAGRPMAEIAADVLPRSAPPEQYGAPNEADAVQQRGVGRL